jgi:hypothetical protein
VINCVLFGKLNVVFDDGLVEPEIIESLVEQCVRGDRLCSIFCFYHILLPVLKLLKLSSVNLYRPYLSTRHQLADVKYKEKQRQDKVNISNLKSKIGGTLYLYRSFVRRNFQGHPTP